MSDQNISPDEWTDEPTGRGGSFGTDPLDSDEAAAREGEGEVAEESDVVSGGGLLGENIGTSEARQENATDPD